MIEWVLVIIFAGYGQPATSVVVPGFTTEAECKSSGAVLLQLHKYGELYCIGQTKK